MASHRDERAHDKSFRNLLLLFLIATVAVILNTIFLILSPERRRIEQGAESLGCTDAVIADKNNPDVDKIKVTCPALGDSLTFFCEPPSPEKELCAHIAVSQEGTILAWTLIALFSITSISSLAVLFKYRTPAHCILDAVRCCVDPMSKGSDGGYDETSPLASAGSA